MTPHWSVSFRTVRSPAYRQEVKELAVWCSLNQPGAEHAQNSGDDRGLQELQKPFYSAIIESVLCTSITVWFRLSYQIWPQKTTEGRSGLLSESLVQPLPLSTNCTHPEWVKEAGNITLDPSHQHTPSLNGYRLVDATELWAPERPDTEPVSSLRQSISWTLTLNVEHTTLLIHNLLTTHTYLFISNLNMSDMYTHNCL